MFDAVRPVTMMSPPVLSGIHLLGFKPLARLKQWHNLRPPTFVYPDEKNQTGSTAAFIALYDAVRPTCQLHKLAKPCSRKCDE